ncbi:MAG: hypothetical protein IAE89_13455 [Anaerolineae bacterium]|nr:hypothetical protein [Anaerolineae bacterium]
MKKASFLLVAVTLLAFTMPVLAQDSANPDAVVSENTNSVAFNNFGFSYDSALGSILTIETLTGDAPDVQQPGGPVPPHTLHALYHPSADGASVNPDFAPISIRLYHTADLAQYPMQAAALSQLQSLLTDRPDLSIFTIAPADISQPFPSLPMLNSVPAAQTIIAQPKYVTTSGFSGIAYITAYRSDVSPFMNNSFIYTFQGISEDGALAVSAWFDLTTLLFPEILPDTFDYNAFATDYLNYLHQSVEILSNASPDDFSPSLTILDTLIASLSD